GRTDQREVDPHFGPRDIVGSDRGERAVRGPLNPGLVLAPNSPDEHFIVGEHPLRGGQGRAIIGAAVPVQLRSELLDLPYRCDPGFRGERDDGRRESRPGEPCEPADLSIPGALVNADRGIVLALDIEHQPVSASTGRLDLLEREDARRDAATTVLRLRGHASDVSGTGQHEYGTGSDDARSVDGDIDPD